jgi:hypothetical protein
MTTVSEDLEHLEIGVLCYGSKVIWVDGKDERRFKYIRKDFGGETWNTGQNSELMIQSTKTPSSSGRTHLYLGGLYGPEVHHGHALIEAMSRWWILSHQEFMQTIDTLVFSWLFPIGRHIENIYIESLTAAVSNWPPGSTAANSPLQWALKLLVAYGFGDKSILFVASTTRITDVWIPTQAVGMGVLMTDRTLQLAREAYGGLVHYWARPHNHRSNRMQCLQEIINRGRCFYLSRITVLEFRNNNKNYAQDKSVVPRFRVCINENEIEEMMLTEFGCIVLRMEQFSMQEQIFLMSHAKLLIGLYGSAMHNAVFVPSGTKVITLGDCRWPDRKHNAQLNIEQTSQALGYFLPLRSTFLDSKTNCYAWDIDHLRGELAHLVDLDK